MGTRLLLLYAACCQVRPLKVFCVLARRPAPWNNSLHLMLSPHHAITLPSIRTPMAPRYPAYDLPSYLILTAFSRQGLVKLKAWQPLLQAATRAIRRNRTLSSNHIRCWYSFFDFCNASHVFRVSNRSFEKFLASTSSVDSAGQPAAFCAASNP